MRKVRLFIETPVLEIGLTLDLEKKQAHYVRQVMRVAEGESLTVFNGTHGLFQARVIDASKRTCRLEIIEQLAPQKNLPPAHLCFAPLKQTPLHFLVEKGTELGVTHFHPVLTERTVVRTFKEDKNRHTALEACEQCERLDVPDFETLQSLDSFLQHLSESDILYVCDERREAKTLAQAYDKTKLTHVLIGPEGGFSPAEFDKLQRHPSVQMIRLSPHILRAETAAIAVLGQLAAL